MKKRIIFSFWALTFGLAFTNCSPDPLPDNVDLLQYFGSIPPATTIESPYEGIDFDIINRFKAVLHTHTRVSDGKQTADEMIKAYADRGYHILAITDHDQVYAKNTGIVNVNGRDILVIKGIELTMTHHFNSLFEDSGKPLQLNVESQINYEIKKHNSVLFLNHPGRHIWFYPMTFYFDLFNKFPAENLVGMEVINNADEYPSDKDTWHKVLTGVSPNRTVYGFANDDAHYYSEIGSSYNEYLTDNLNEAEVRNAIVHGKSFFYTNATVSRPTGSMPYVKDVIVNRATMTITVEAENYSKIEWRSCGVVVCTDEEIAINNDGYNFYKYVQFTLTGPGGQLFSQPFLIK
ncbi:MAG: PHP domain-containing protein [Bacteroidales bacterium]|nr:PHP domain-containing protein [Bacteroidales bacterium]